MPIINFNNSRTFTVSEGMLRDDNNNNETYTLLSKDSILSKTTTLFRRSIQVIGRSCVVSNSINSTSTASGKYLVENYKFTFTGELTITENCIINSKSSSKDWTFINEANISLPLSCSINSSLINCGSVNLHSSKAKMITLKENRMQILKREHTKEKKATLTKDDFLTNPFNSENLSIHNVWSRSVGGITFYKWIIIGIATIATMILGIWCYCRISKTVDQTEKTTNIEMKIIYQTDMPAYMHPEAQIKTPDAPPPVTAHKRISPNIR